VRDKLSIAALVVSGVAFLLVFFSPAPEVPAESAGTRSEGIVNRVQAETNALAADASELLRLNARGEALASMREASHPDSDETEKLIASMIKREIERRMPAYQNQLKIIRLYRKDAEEKKAPEAAPPQALAPKKGAGGNQPAAKQTPEQQAVARRKALEKRKAAILKAREAARKRATERKAAEKKTVPDKMKPAAK